MILLGTSISKAAFQKFGGQMILNESCQKKIFFSYRYVSVERTPSNLMITYAGSCVLCTSTLSYHTDLAL